MSISVPTIEFPRAGRVAREPRVSLFQKILLTVAAAPTGVAAIWAYGDLTYQQHFDPPAGWWVLVLFGITGWTAVAIRFGQERIMREQRVIIANQIAINQYNADLAERLDTYGDHCRIEGHRIAASAVNGGPRLHVVD